jgi:hypothetical protein
LTLAVRSGNSCRLGCSFTARCPSHCVETQP